MKEFKLTPELRTGTLSKSLTKPEYKTYKTGRKSESVLHVNPIHIIWVSSRTGTETGSNIDPLQQCILYHTIQYNTILYDNMQYHTHSNTIHNQLSRKKLFS